MSHPAYGLLLIVLGIMVSNGCESNAKKQTSIQTKVGLESPENRVLNIKLRRQTQKEKDEASKY